MDTECIIPIAPIIPLTKSCNLACVYCYTGSSTFKDTVKNDTTNYPNKICEIVSKFVEYNNPHPTRVILHGGEPLTLGYNTLEQIIKRCLQLDNRIKFSIQTNASLITDSFIDLFLEHNINVGVSLDGPIGVDSFTRKQKNGLPSFDIVYPNLKKLVQQKVKCGALVTINKHSLSNIKGIYEFFINEELPFDVRSIFKTKCSTQINSLDITPDEYAGAVCKLFDYWFEDKNSNFSYLTQFTSHITQFIKPIKGLVSCNFTENCHEHYMCVDPKGDAYPCMRFYDMKEFCYGNLKTLSIQDILQSKISKEFQERTNFIKRKCQHCSVYKYCLGGCPANAFFYSDTLLNKDYYCEAYKIIINYILKRVKETFPVK